MSNKVSRALISVFDKSGVVEFAQALVEAGVELLSTGGTFKLLCEHKVPVKEVSEHTGFPEIMSGRVKTLHPKIFGGILARRRKDKAVLELHDIDAIDLVVVNFYPFEETVAKKGCSLADAVENVDIGGPTMVRAAAKNFEDVAVVVDPGDYGAVVAELEDNDGRVSREKRFELAVKAFELIAGYDAAIAGYFSGQLAGDDVGVDVDGSRFPRQFSLDVSLRQGLRYGENPHQQAAFYVKQGDDVAGTVAGARQLQGKSLSFNNIVDADAAWCCVSQFAEPACVIVKHANPCGVALGDSILSAYQKAFECDPTSAFGGIIAVNRPLDVECVDVILDKQFVEVIVVPEVSEAAVRHLESKSNVRVLVCGEYQSRDGAFDFKRVQGGLLVQDADDDTSVPEFKVVSQKQPSEQQLVDLKFAWQVVKFVKSNAIVYVKDGRTVGIGAGQMSRVYSAKVACLKAQEVGLSLDGAVMASDAFFPFRDGVDAAADFKIAAVVQPGGSVRDEEVVEAADEHGMAMVLTGVRHFRD